MSNLKIFATSHSVCANSENVYVVTSSYEMFLDDLLKGQHVHLIGGRQKGKTSSIQNAIQELVACGHRCLDISLALHVDATDIREVSSLMFRECAQQLELDENIFQVDGNNLTYSIVLALRAIATHAPKRKRVYLFLDELDTILRLKPAEVSSFLAGLRNFAININPESRLTIVTASVFTPEELGRLGTEPGSSQPVFGTMLHLKGFDVNDKTVDQLVEGFPKETPELRIALLNALQWTNGHPQPMITFCNNLLRYLLLDIEVQKAFEQVKIEMPRLARSHVDALRHQLSSRKEAMPPLLHLFEEISRCEARGAPRRYEQLSMNLASLEAIGLVHRESDATYRVANEFYRIALNQTWVDDLLTQYYHILKGKRGAYQSDNGKNVLIILTGGTIGMRIESGQAIFRPAWVKDILSTDLAQISSAIQIEFFDFKDGINMHPEDWLEIFKTIKVWRERGWADAVIVAHGTDTLAYTACGLAFAYGAALDFPLVFTGAQCTLDMSHGDARQNMLRSYKVALAAIEARICEVMICFDDQVYKACRAQKVHDQHFRGFASPNWPILAQVSEQVEFNKAALVNRMQPPHQPEVLYSSNILYINIVPGQRSKVFSQVLTKETKIDGIILATPGAGNIPSLGNYSFHELIDQARECGIPVLINSQVPIDPELFSTYRAANEPIKKGAIFAGNMTQPAALTKFSWAIKSVKNLYLTGEALIRNVGILMNENLIDEIGEFGQQKSPLGFASILPVPIVPQESLPGRQRVCIILTGGTIGMIKNNNTNEFNLEMIRKLIEPELRLLADVSFEQLGPKDGIDMNQEDWRALYELILNLRRKNLVDGVVITHGTDTLVYSASALAFSFGSELDFPIVFTGAQTTLDRLHGDSRSNILRSVFVAAQASMANSIIPEVMVCFADQVYRGVRCEKVHDQYFQGFASPTWPVLAQITDSLKVNWSAVRTVTPNPGEFVGFADNILYINILPGLKVEIYNQFLLTEEKIDGIILATPGVGNIPSEGDYNFHQFLRLAKEKQVPVLITSQVPVSPPVDYHYRAAQEPIDTYGAILAGNMTQAAALTKFSCAIFSIGQEGNGNRIAAVAELMRKDWVGEINLRA